MDGDLMIDVAGLRMFGRPGLGPYVVKDEGLEGWEDGVDMRSDNVPMPHQHGSYVLPRYQESRTVSIQGVILAESARDLTNYKQRLSGLLAHGRAGRVQVTTGGLTLWAEAMLASRTKVTRRRGTHYADFALNLWFPDPRQFGNLNKFSSPSGATTPLFHRGNADAWPSFTVTGSMPGGYTLRVANRAFTVLQPLTSGSHVVDFRNGRLRVNGSLVSGGVGTANLTPVPPGTGASFQLQPVSGSGTAAVNVYDTYI